MPHNCLNHDVAFERQHDNERRIAAAERRRLAKAARHAEGSSDCVGRTGTAPVPRLSAIGLVDGAWRLLGRGLVVVVGQRQSA